MRVIVVGGGIVGCATAWALARAGAEAVLVEAGPVPNPRAASSDHHRLIRFAYPGEPVYTRRVFDAFAAWRRLWADLGRPEQRYFAATGVLTLVETPGDRGDLARAEMEAAGVPLERIAGDAFARRLPHLEPGCASEAILSPGGALMANRILADLADRLRAQGVAVHELCPVVRVDASAGEVALADGRRIGGDLVVVAAGTGARELAPDLAAALRPNRSLIAYAVPPADLAAAWAGAPCWTRLAGDLWGIAPVEGLPLKLGCGDLGRTDETDDDRTIRPEEVAALLAAYRGRFRGIDRFELRFAQANYWTLAPEERFVLARRDRLVLASADSGHGFKFGALSGEDIAAALTGAEPFETVATRMAGRVPEPA